MVRILLLNKFHSFVVLLHMFVVSVLTKIIKSGYAALQLEYFFTAGPDEVRAWNIRVRMLI